MYANRTKIRTLQQLVDFLWDFDDGQPRVQWSDRAYRQLHQQALTILQIHLGAEAAQRIHDGIKRIFILTNWMVPYLSNSRFIQRNGRKDQL